MKLNFTRLSRVSILFTALATASADTDSIPAPVDLQRRIYSRDFPSVFQAWSPADNLTGENPAVTFARHDLAIEGPGNFGLRWNNAYIGLSDDFIPATITKARKIRTELLKHNPHTVLVAEIRYRDAPDRYLPSNSLWWKRKAGVRTAGWAEGHSLMLDFSNADFRAQVAKQAHAAIASGVFDGVFLDWWNSDDDDRLALIRAVRAAVGENALILLNVNDEPRPRSASFVNGYYMECYRSATPKDWRRIANTLRWAEKTLRPPRINCVETWFHKSRQDLDLMRATTTLALTMSNGYCLFGDPDSLPVPDHLHDWYDFWDKRLGRPVAQGSERTDAGWEREFENGSAVYNPMGNSAIVVRFEKPRRRLSTGKMAIQFTVPACDGDIFLTVP